MRMYTWVKEIKPVSNVEEINEFLNRGWKIIATYNPTPSEVVFILALSIYHGQSNNANTKLQILSLGSEGSGHEV